MKVLYYRFLVQFEDDLKEVALSLTLRCVGLVWSHNITQQTKEFNFLFLASHTDLHHLPFMGRNWRHIVLV